MEGVTMKKKIIGATILAAVSTIVVVVLRRFGPELARRGMQKCHEMMAGIAPQGSSEQSVQFTGDCSGAHQGGSGDEQKPQAARSAS
jgi:hypothetical protein